MRKTTIAACLLLLPAAGAFSQKADTIPVPVDSGYLNVEGGRLYYETAGAGDYIVLLHDGLLHRVVWDGQFFELAKHYRVVRYDRRGYGKSSVPQAPFSNVGDLNQLFTQLKIDEAVVFGMSSGGRLAIDFTLKYPDKVNGLVLVGAVVSGYGYSTHFNTRGGRLKSHSEISEPSRFIRYFGWEDPYEISPDNIEAKKAFMKLLEANPGNFNEALDNFASPPDRPAVKSLSEIKVPTLVLVGENDIPDVHAHSGVIEAGIPNARREIVPRAGHLIPFEQPEAFNAVVFRFLNSLDFISILNSQGVSAAVQYFHKKREVDPGYTPFEENQMNALGYASLQQGRIEEAIELFTLNTIAFPESANTFDSLGEAYLTAGNKELAIKNYEKSLELNPQNQNAADQLKKLRGN